MLDQPQMLPVNVVARQLERERTTAPFPHGPSTHPGCPPPAPTAPAVGERGGQVVGEGEHRDLGGRRQQQAQHLLMHLQQQQQPQRLTPSAASHHEGRATATVAAAAAAGPASHPKERHAEGHAGGEAGCGRGALGEDHGRRHLPFLPGSPLLANFLPFPQLFVSHTCMHPSRCTWVLSMTPLPSRGPDAPSRRPRPPRCCPHRGHCRPTGPPPPPLDPPTKIILPRGTRPVDPDPLAASPGSLNPLTSPGSDPLPGSTAPPPPPPRPTPAARPFSAPGCTQRWQTRGRLSLRGQQGGGMPAGGAGGFQAGHKALLPAERGAPKGAHTRGQPPTHAWHEPPTQASSPGRCVRAWPMAHSSRRPVATSPAASRSSR